MRKGFAFILVLALLCGGLASAENLPTVDQALASGGSGRIKVQSDLPAYDFYGASEVDYGELKTIILERRCPDKEFTEYDSGYPDDYKEDLPEDFIGVDLGEIETWVRVDMMEQLPEYCRATSLADADYLFVVESQYYWAGTVTVTDFESGSDDVPDREFKTAEELAAYNLTHPKVISAITHYPKFSHELYAYLYDPATGKTENFNYRYVPVPRFGRNPVAADIDYEMGELESAGTRIEVGLITTGSELTEFFGSCDYIPAEKVTFWGSCLDSGETAAAVSSMEEYYWTLAGMLAENDPEENQAKSLNTAIESRNREFLTDLIGLYDYSGFDTPIETIRSKRSYMSMLEESAYDEFITEYVALFE